MKSICFPPSASEAPQVRRAGPALRLLTADCLLHLRESGWRGFFAGMAALDKMSPATVKEKTSKFKK